MGWCSFSSTTKSPSSKIPLAKDTMANNANPGNFANRPHEDVENIARKGGQSSHQGGFASMDPGDQVCKASSDMKYAAWN